MQEELSSTKNRGHGTYTQQMYYTGFKHLCSVCGKSFNCKSALEMHSRVHTGHKPFKCDVCQRAFTQKGNLRSHMISHMDKSSLV